MHSNVFL